MVKVIGLDLSLTATGIAGVAGGVGWTEVIGSASTVADDYYARHVRIEDLAVAVIDYCRTADLIVVEGPALASKVGAAFDRAALWWTVVGRMIKRGQPVAVVPPTNRAGYATGKGGAGKGAVIEQVSRRFGHVWTDLNGDDNAADAAVLCAMGLDRLGECLVTLPETHRKHLQKVFWPAVPGYQVEP